MDMLHAYETRTYIESAKDIIRSDSEEQLGTVLSLVSSSHTPVCIFSKENTYLGIVSPYQAFYSHRYPFRTKIATLTVMTPYITEDTPLFAVASYMLSSRVYVLPVLDEERSIQGVIRIKNVLKGLLKDIDFLHYVEMTVNSHIPITASLQASVGEIYDCMRTQKVSRVVLVDHEGDVAGIISRKDLLNAFMKPTPKQRFGKNGTPPSDWAFDTEKIYRKDDPAKTYATLFVDKASFDVPKKELIQKLLSSQHNSLVLVNSTNKPVGFLSLRDIIAALAALEPENDLNIIMHKPTGKVPEKDIERAESHIQKFGQKMKKRIAIEKIEVNTEEAKYTTGETAEFATIVVITPTAGKKYVAKAKRAVFLESIQAATDQIEKQERRKGTTKEETLYSTG